MYVFVFWFSSIWTTLPCFEDFPTLCILGRGRTYLLVSRLEVPGIWFPNIPGYRATSLSPRLYHVDALCHSLESATGMAIASGVLSSGHRGNCIKTEFLCDPEVLSLHQVCCMTESFVVRYIPSSPNFPDSERFWQIFFVLKNQPELVYGFVSLEAKNLVTTYFSVLPPSLCQLSLQARIPLTSQ